MTLDKRALALSVGSVALAVVLALAAREADRPLSEQFTAAAERGYVRAQALDADADAAADEAASTSAMDAGYRWAESQGIDHLDECDGRPADFRKGCAEYLDDQNEGTALVRPNTVPPPR